MKKILSIFVAIAIFTAAFSVAVSAQTINQSDPQNGSATLTTSINPTYTVTIPEDTTVTYNTLLTDFGSVTLTSANLEPYHFIEVAATADTTFKNDADQSYTIPFKIVKADSPSTQFTSANFNAVNDSQPLKIAVVQSDWNAAKAGSYKATVTFDINYNSVS